MKYIIIVRVDYILSIFRIETKTTNYNALISVDFEKHKTKE